MTSKEEDFSDADSTSENDVPSPTNSRIRYGTDLKKFKPDDLKAIAAALLEDFITSHSKPFDKVSPSTRAFQEQRRKETLLDVVKSYWPEKILANLMGSIISPHLPLPELLELQRKLDECFGLTSFSTSPDGSSIIQSSEISSEVTALTTRTQEAMLPELMAQLKPREEDQDNYISSEEPPKAVVKPPKPAKKTEYLKPKDPEKPLEAKKKKPEGEDYWKNGQESPMN